MNYLKCQNQNLKEKEKENKNQKPKEKEKQKLKNYKYNTICSLHEVECFLTNLTNACKCIKTYKFFKK